MYNAKFLSLAVGTFTFFASASSSLAGGAPHVETQEILRELRQERQEQRAEPEIVNWTGTVRCKEMRADGECELEFVRAASGESFDLSSDGELKDVYCNKASDFKVQLAAERTPKFLFWGGDLDVKAYRAEGGLKSGNCEITETAALDERFLYHPVKSY